MDFRELGFNHFLKNYGERHIFEEALRSAYNTGYGDGWRDKRKKIQNDSPKIILFVFENNDECYRHIKDKLLSHTTYSTNHLITMNNGSQFMILSPEQIRHEALRGHRVHIAYIDPDVDVDGKITSAIIPYLDPMNNSRTEFLTFKEFRSMNLEEVWHGL